MDWEQVVLVEQVEQVEQVERGQAVHWHRRWELKRAVEVPEQGERF